MGKAGNMAGGSGGAKINGGRKADFVVRDAFISKGEFVYCVDGEDYSGFGQSSFIDMFSGNQSSSEVLGMDFVRDNVLLTMSYTPYNLGSSFNTVVQAFRVDDYGACKSVSSRTYSQAANGALFVKLDEGKVLLLHANNGSSSNKYITAVILSLSETGTITESTVTNIFSAGSSDTSELIASKISSDRCVLVFKHSSTIKALVIDAIDGVITGYTPVVVGSSRPYRLSLMLDFGDEFLVAGPGSAGEQDSYFTLKATGTEISSTANVLAPTHVHLPLKRSEASVSKVDNNTSIVVYRHTESSRYGTRAIPVVKDGGSYIWGPHIEFHYNTTYVASRCTSVYDGNGEITVVYLKDTGSTSPMCMRRAKYENGLLSFASDVFEFPYLKQQYSYASACSRRRSFRVFLCTVAGVVVGGSDQNLLKLTYFDKRTPNSAYNVYPKLGGNAISLTDGSYEGGISVLCK